MTPPSYVCLVPFSSSNPDPPVDALYHGPLSQSHSTRVRQGPSPPINFTQFLAPVVLVVGNLHSIDMAQTLRRHAALTDAFLARGYIPPHDLDLKPPPASRRYLR
jgi:hypothetical protein